MRRTDNIRSAGSSWEAGRENNDGRSAQYAGNSVRDWGASMNGGAVMFDRSPFTVARKEMKSLRAERLPSLDRMLEYNGIMLECVFGLGRSPLE